MPPKKGDECFVEFDSMAGEKINTRDFKEDYVLIDVWATWCGPCTKSIPELGIIFSQYKKKGFKLIGISCDEEEIKLKKFMEEKDVNWPMHFDGNGPDNKIAMALEVTSVPVMILVGPGGKVVNPNIKTKDLAVFLKKQLGDPTTVEASPPVPVQAVHEVEVEILTDNGSGSSSTHNLTRSVSATTLELLGYEKTLHELVQDSRSYPLTRDAFTAYLKTQFCEEQFLFLVALEETLSPFQGSSAVELTEERKLSLVEKLKEINSKFIDDKGEMPVNISFAQKKKFFQRFEAAQHIEQYEDAYTPVVKECRALILQGKYIAQFLDLKSQNITKEEKDNRMMVAGVSFILALALVAALVVLNKSRWLRLTALPLLIVSTSYYESGKRGV